MLERYGWVATSNAIPEDDRGKQINYKSNLERLQAQAREENNFFRDNGHGDWLVDGFDRLGPLKVKVIEDEMPGLNFLRNIPVVYVVPLSAQVFIRRKIGQPFVTGIRFVGAH